MDVEAALQVITGRLGRFHWAMCSLLSTAYVCQALFNMTYVFTTMRSEHRCLVPECETADSLADMHPPWLPLAVPTATTGTLGLGDPCRRYASLGGQVRCSEHAFSNVTLECDRWVYPNKDLSIMTEWDMTCSLSGEWQLALVGTANNLGRALGLPLFGYVSDALGRRTALLGGLAVSCCLGLARSFAPDYATFVSLEFLDPVFYDGIGGAAFIMGMELVPTPSRGAWSAVSHVIFALGLALLGVVAWLLPRWRLLLRVLYGSALLCLAALWFVPESIRWLASKGRTEEAFRVINKAAKMNRLPRFTPHNAATASDSGQSQHQEPKLDQDSPRPSFAKDMMEFGRSRIMMLRLLVCCLSWVAIMFVYEGLAVYSVSMAGSRYLNFVLVELVEVPASLITWRLMALAGRRSILVGSLVPAAACCVAYHFLPAAAEADGISWSRTAAVMLAKLFITLAFTCTYVVSAELFPTRVRHTMYALGATCGRLGSALSPQMPLLSAVMESLPLLVFGAVCFLCGLLVLTLPETARVALPDSVEEAEAIGKKKPPSTTATTTPERTDDI